MAMTKAERDELAKLLKARARVANRVVEQRAAELLAYVEEKLAAQYEIDDAAWKDVTATARKAAQAADAEIARRCRQRGIPKRFRPSIGTYWLDRGENFAPRRRAELRKVAETRIDALAKQARVAIETTALDGVTKLVAGALESAEARAFLAAMPSVEALMPALDVRQLGPLALRDGGSEDEEDA